MITNIAEGFLAHLERYRQKGRSQFLCETVVESILLSTAVLCLMNSFGHVSHRTDLDHLRAGRLFRLLVVTAPLLETLLFQSLPVALGRYFNVGFWEQVFASWVLFALPHFFVSVDTGMVAGVVGGFYLAFTYVNWRERSFSNAYWMTAASHAAHNLMVMFVLIGAPGAHQTL